MDHINILSTYLPLFTPIKGEVMKELSDNKKGTIMYDPLPNYYIKEIKDATTEPIEMNIEELFQFALNIEEAVINPGKDSEGNPRKSKEQRAETTIPRKQGVGVKIINSGVKTFIFKVKNYHLVIFVLEKATPKQHAALSKNQWPLLKRTPRTELLSGKRIKLKKFKPFLQLLHLLNKMIVLVTKMRMTRTKRLL
jgi:hypothetical protein